MNSARLVMKPTIVLQPWLFTILIILFFFFQAEDGIRDLTVTGVQTCALPIFDSIHLVFSGPVGMNNVVQTSSDLIHWTSVGPGTPAGTGTNVFDDPLVMGRSEERRVGKECRSRWSPYH